jgi:hypothetical protein
MSSDTLFDTFAHLQTIRHAMTDNLFSICEPRPDVLQEALRESDFAADLSQVLRGDAPDEFLDASLRKVAGRNAQRAGDSSLPS